MDPQEQALIASAKEGNAQAFGELYDRYIKSIYDFIYYKTWHKETAEDLTSQTFFKALRQLASYAPKKAEFSTWLYSIARNTVIDHYRTNRPQDPIEDALALSSQGETDIRLDARLKLEKVKEALARLTPMQREIILLRVWQEKSHEEIAAITGKTESAVKMAYSRAIKQLRSSVPLSAYLFFLLHL